MTNSASNKKTAADTCWSKTH